MTGFATDWRTQPWAQHLRREKLLTGTVEFVDLAGPDGAPILLIHGLGGHWQHWLANLTELSYIRRVIALDLPGCGRSTPLEGRPSVVDYAAVVEALCRRLGVERVVLVGHSFGGLVATEVSARRPDLVERLILVSVPALPVGRASRVTATAAIGAMSRISTRLGRAYPRLLRRRRVRWLVLFRAARRPGRLSPELVYFSLLAAPTRSLGEIISAALRYAGQEFSSAADRVLSPTFVLWGENDHLVPSAHAEPIAQQLPTRQVILLPATGHLVMVERPALFNTLVAGAVSIPLSPLTVAAD